MSAVTTTNKSLQQLQRQQQHSRLQRLHLGASYNNNNSNSSYICNSYSSISCISIACAVVLGLLLAGNCVNGQIDGYIAGEDYPAYDAVPRGLSFNCQGRQPGYYADTETRCQVWHWCLHSGHQYSFLCPNGTVFNQAVRVCDWWSNVNCAGSEQLYQNNDELYRIPQRSQQLQQQQQDEQQQNNYSKNTEYQSRHSSSNTRKKISRNNNRKNSYQVSTGRPRNRTSSILHSNKSTNDISSNNNNHKGKQRGNFRYNQNKFENDDELKDYKSRIKNKYNIDYDHSLDEEYELIEAIE
ncbi:hypothetical protein KR222_001889 [Zaprionus bogoriensis]|nr:hypothetical protein KR222_001889 [Zaprionus bogoriensis]